MSNMVERKTRIEDKERHFLSLEKKYRGKTWRHLEATKREVVDRRIMDGDIVGQDGREMNGENGGNSGGWERCSP